MHPLMAPLRTFQKCLLVLTCYGNMCNLVIFEGFCGIVRGTGITGQSILLHIVVYTALNIMLYRNIKIKFI